MQPRKVRADGSVPAAGWLNLDLGGPNPGKLWNLRLANIVPDPVTTTLVGVALLIVGTVPRGTDIPSPADVQDWTDVFPNVGPWSRGTIYVEPGNHLGISFLGTPVAAEVIGTANIEEFDASDAPILGLD